MPNFIRSFSAQVTKILMEAENATTKNLLNQIPLVYYMHVRERHNTCLRIQASSNRSQQRVITTT